MAILKSGEIEKGAVEMGASMMAVSARTAPKTRGVDSVKIIVLTVYQDQYLAQAVEAGAIGYLLKDTSREELIQAIKIAYRGQSPLSPSVAQTLIANYGSLTKASRASILSPRQLEILRLIASGATNKEIASKLFLSEATIKRDTQAIFAKLGVADRAHAVSEGHKRKLI